MADTPLTAAPQWMDAPADVLDRTAVTGVAELFRQWRLPMARLAYVLTSDAERADEIVQDAFLKVPPTGRSRSTMRSSTTA
jgi:DNA-directed RNA polymerase specialized sigma24 family protein